MKIKGKHAFKCGDPEQVWKLLMDFKFLSNIIPKLKDVKQVDDHKFKSKLPVKMFGFTKDVKITFTLKQVKKPKSFRLIAKGSGIKGTGNFLLDQKKSGTTVRYRVDVTKWLGKKIKKALPKLFDKIDKECCKEIGDAH